MANKTAPSEISVSDYLATINNAQKREDSAWLITLMQRLTGEEPVMWGQTIIGFGHYHYEYASGREGDCFVAGFAPRSREMVIYLMGTLANNEDRLQNWDQLMSELGPHKLGKSCLYIKKLELVDKDVLEKLVAGSIKAIRATYPTV